jgi:hypothetical protein
VPAHARLRSTHEAPDDVEPGAVDHVELAAAGIVPDGQLQVASSTWFLYGHTSYDGEVVLARYDDAGAAARALRTAVAEPRAVLLAPDLVRRSVGAARSGATGPSTPDPTHTRKELP